MLTYSHQYYRWCDLWESPPSRSAHIQYVYNILHYHIHICIIYICVYMYVCTWRELLRIAQVCSYDAMLQHCAANPLLGYALGVGSPRCSITREGSDVFPPALRVMYYNKAYCVCLLSYKSYCYCYSVGYVTCSTPISKCAVPYVT